MDEMAGHLGSVKRCCGQSKEPLLSFVVARSVGLREQREDLHKPADPAVVVGAEVWKAEKDRPEQWPGNDSPAGQADTPCLNTASSVPKDQASSVRKPADRPLLLLLDSGFAGAKAVADHHRGRFDEA